MGVELQHCGLYGYRFDGRFPWDKMHREGKADLANKLMNDYELRGSEEGDFVICQDPRGSKYCIAGIVQFVTNSSRWNGPQQIGPTVMEKPDSVLIEEMEQIIDENFQGYVERKTDSPEHIVFNS